MDCESCGRYRPSAEIAPLRGEGRRLVIACARCRRIAATRPVPATAAPLVTTPVPGVPVPAS